MRAHPVSFSGTHRINRGLGLGILMLFAGGIVIAQGIQPDTLRYIQYGPALPGIVKETSGLAFTDGIVWTINDSQNKPILFGMEPGTWKIKSRIRVKGVANNDWEEVTMGPDGFIIGDFGDNRGVRDTRDLLFIPKAKKIKRILTLTPKTLTFRFQGEMFMDPPGNRHNRDMEAMTWIGDRLMLFTKNRKDHLTYVLEIKDLSTDTLLKPIGVLQAGGLVTGAAYHAENDWLVLCGYARARSFLYIVPGFLKSNMDSDLGKRVILQGIDGSQVEGVTWIGNDSLLISTEKTGVMPASAFLIPINHLARNPRLNTELLRASGIRIEDAAWTGENNFGCSIISEDNTLALLEVITFRGDILYKESLTLNKGINPFAARLDTKPTRDMVFVLITHPSSTWSALIQEKQ